MTSWIVLQLADSAFPTGGFAHSAGLEAHVQAGEPASLERFCRELIDQLAHGSLPMVGAVHDDPARLAEVDAFARATLWSHVAARASRTKAARCSTSRRAASASQKPAPAWLDGHLAPVFGYVTRMLGVDRDEALATFLHLALRGLLSAAVRLGCAGPSEAQSLHPPPPCARDRTRQRGLTLADVAQTSPLVELIGATHDRLYSRLFQS